MTDFRFDFSFPREVRRAAARKLLRASDGDTPVIEQPIRMVSVDTPEKAGYAGRAELAQAKLDTCRERLAGDFYKALPKGLRGYLADKLDAEAAARHIEAGERAGAFFDAMLEERLTRPDGRKRRVATIPTGQIIDSYSRLLAYLAPYFDANELPPKDDPRRRTFNLDMVAAGWAAFFPLYPSLPGNAELALICSDAETAWKKKRGAWKDFGRSLLLGYEYRMCIKLGTAKTAKAGLDEAFQRSCVDLRSMKDLGPHGFWQIAPPYRLWYWLEDRAQARRDLGLGA
ncbi:MAG TPA: hypothetical protein VFR90_15635 [Methylibium sp.]|uniref:hypothetical protein n=1 Tax=Methylibium sp. TaxID=2067992 RepID=UPI002DB58955|nr:hypothetical protein [Methylibium sp.]HEU4460552.1 hypothetical protein [Methylibium sp.]